MDTSGWPNDYLYFENEAYFLQQTDSDKRRRGALFAAARRDDAMSYYEARHVPKDELVAMAVVREHVVGNEYAATGDVRKGTTADNCDLFDVDDCWMIPDDPQENLEKCAINRISKYGYLLHVSCNGEDIVVPSRMAFVSDEVAEFMRRELIAYVVAPENRQ